MLKKKASVKRAVGSRATGGGISSASTVAPLHYSTAEGFFSTWQNRYASEQEYNDGAEKFMQQPTEYADVGPSRSKK